MVTKIDQANDSTGTFILFGITRKNSFRLFLRENKRTRLFKENLELISPPLRA